MVAKDEAGQILVELVKTLRVFRVAGHQGRATISGTKVGVLQFLKRRDARLSELAEQLSVSPSVASRAVDSLEADGLAERCTDTQDARAVLISITERGRADLADREGYIAEKFAGVLSDWDAADVEEALHLLQRLNSHLDELAEALAHDYQGDTSA